MERILLDHQAIREVAVVGVEDKTWGQRVGAVIVSHDPDSQLQLEDVKTWASSRMPSYMIPTLVHQMGEIPKNAMGKINKKQLVKIAFPDS